MQTRRRIWLVALVCAALLLASSPVLVQAAPPGDDGTIFLNEDFELEDGERHDSDVIVFNGDVRLGTDSRVEGTIVIWNGDADVDGTVTGDLVVSGGLISLGEDALIAGNVICSWGCELEREEGSRIEGETVEGLTIEAFDLEWLGDLRIAWPVTRTFDVSGPSLLISWLINMIQTAVGILVVTAVSALVKAIWPQQAARGSVVVVAEPVASVGVGLLTSVVASVLLFGLAITICLSPFALIGGLVLGAAGLFGWACVAAEVGDRLLSALNVRDVAPPWSAALGSFVMSFVTVGLATLPFIGFCLGAVGGLVATVVGWVGLGAVVLTRFGTTAYPNPSIGTAAEALPEPAPKPKRQRRKKEE